MTEQSCWLIERQLAYEGDVHEWWDGKEFHPNVQFAVRFCRKVDAQAVFIHLPREMRRVAVVTEHLWMEPTKP